MYRILETVLKKFLIIVAIALCALIVFEGIGLYQLASSKGRYATYWKHRATMPGDFIYLALGDSAAQGLGASKAERGYVGLLAGQLELQTGQHIRVINLSVSGATLQDVLNNQLPQVKNYLPELITVEIGANDMPNYNAKRFREQYTQIAKSLPPGSVVATVPYFGTLQKRNPNAVNANQIIIELARAYHFSLVDLYSLLEQRQSPTIYAADLFHPNDRGYRIWYEAFQPAVAETLLKPHE